ncbi:helix-turn-helix transcriptional regulator [Methylobacterium oxalidis]|uniref:helix-turn-helix transcriptional regulator n=1 Tax=Methylobacterium oxalidis TaxID=944322 RepID=UPI003316442F
MSSDVASSPIVSAPREFLTPAEAAAQLALTARALESYRTRGGGPAFHKLGRNVRYRLSDLIAWAEAGKRLSTRER